MEKKQLEDVCYTREVALEKAVEIEMNRFKVYKDAYLNARDRLAKDLLKDLALDELKHKYTLEKAVFEETVLLHDTGYSEGPTYNLHLPPLEKPLSDSADAVDVIRYAIQDEKQTVVFYRTMAEQCKGAPMAAMFKQLAQDEEDHLARLERLYEDGHMPVK
jgi:rubrerythrin